MQEIYQCKRWSMSFERLFNKFRGISERRYNAARAHGWLNTGLPRD